MKTFNDLPDVFYLGFYHPRYIYYENCYEDNEYFNEYSHTILELKDGKYDAINFFLKELKYFLSDEDIAITTVPPHTSANSSSGIRELAKQLVKSYINFTDAVSCLERFQNSSRNRTKDNHLKSIKVANSSVIQDKKVILMDDVLTTGSSIQVCKTLLLEAGAKEVKVIVLGKTIRNVEDAHYFIEQNQDEYIKETLDELNLEHNLVMQQYEMETDYLTEEESNEHNEVDKWAEEQHSYFGLDDEDHYYIEEVAQQQHEEINETYNYLLYEIIKKQKEDSDFQNHEIDIVADQCQDYINETHQVLDGSTCFSVDNPLLFYFNDW
ncbi:ComF family protein [Planktothrix sp. FACHB-1365]|uniref:ComF family protein n=1 Tax=Planktothrix sp. FACHB-1365 TaxID=2692855 RepID=UPI001684076F|nr:phosphoribosyltransferase family protein [Planktothrix sp. FACHB-1365]MBD2485094.1 hypothetical protein [Planktothrix sp. FACHB-1365]